uniref:Dynein light intermediate chain n=1 Tax=Meloidogyne incognita TaxID=6306 RepID=A0A914MQQ1_MELIC
MVGDQRPSSPLLLPPEKGILEENCGATLFVVITKSDLHTEFSTEQLDKVQYHVRQFCLRHGAALVFFSVIFNFVPPLLFTYSNYEKMVRLFFFSQLHSSSPWHTISQKGLPFLNLFV